MPHHLQKSFATAAGEQDCVRHIGSLIENGQLSEAETILTADIAALDTDIARLCMSTSLASIEISGWQEMVDALMQYEGEPITAIAIGMANDADLAFSPKGLYDPFLTLGFYSDESFAFSVATRETMLDECAREDPAWAGREEDIEAYLELEGLAELNTALLRHKTQYHFRAPEDEPQSEVPIAYIEYVLAGWFRALRFHQAVKAQLDQNGLPGDIPAITGIANMRPEIAAVHYPAKSLAVSAPALAELTIKARPKKLDAMIDLSGASIRQKLVEDAATTETLVAAEAQVESKGFLARLFGRGRS